jgi:transcriptional regulator with XRE-family HTH domain
MLENPSEPLLYRLIRIIKFQNLVASFGGNQAEFAEKAGISQGAVSVFLRARKKLLTSRWEGILDRLGVEEPETTESDIVAARELFARMRDDEGYQLQNRLREGNVNMQEFAKRCGVSQGQLSWWFVSDKFNLDTRERIAKALEEMEIKKSPG